MWIRAFELFGGAEKEEGRWQCRVEGSVFLFSSFASSSFTDDGCELVNWKDGERRGRREREIDDNLFLSQ